MYSVVRLLQRPVREFSHSLALFLEMKYVPFDMLYVSHVWMRVFFSASVREFLAFFPFFIRRIACLITHRHTCKICCQILNENSCLTSILLSCFSYSSFSSSLYLFTGLNLFPFALFVFSSMNWFGFQTFHINKIHVFDFVHFFRVEIHSRSLTQRSKAFFFRLVCVLRCRSHRCAYCKEYVRERERKSENDGVRNACAYVLFFSA